VDVPVPDAARADHEDQPRPPARAHPRDGQERPRLLGLVHRRLTREPKFLRDVVARKTFSKLRSAIAGLYAYRRMFDEADTRSSRRSTSTRSAPRPTSASRISTCSSTESEPNDPSHWIELAAAHLANDQGQECIDAVQQAVVRGGENARRTLRTDPRFAPIRQAPAFQQLVPPAAPGTAPGGLTLPFGPSR
jgi:hypothetical protein